MFPGTEFPRPLAFASMTMLDHLEPHVAGYGSALVAYSGGVDSTLVAVVARRVFGPDRMLAVLARSPSLSDAAATRAIELARQFDLPLLTVTTRELDDPRYQANAPNRCYYCKTTLWGRLVPIARERRLKAVLDGTTADDLAPSEHRPGHGAAREAGVRSPLAELGVGKEAVRRAARALGLPNWDAPAAPCLASRVRFGLPVTETRLRQVETAEAIVRRAGIRGDLRVRHLGETARVEVAAAELPHAQSVWPDLERRLREVGFATVELDPRGYRRGAMMLDTTGQCDSSSP